MKTDLSAVVEVDHNITKQCFIQRGGGVILHSDNTPAHVTLNTKMLISIIEKANII